MTRQPLPTAPIKYRMQHVQYYTDVQRLQQPEGKLWEEIAEIWFSPQALEFADKDSRYIRCQHGRDDWLKGDAIKEMAKTFKGSLFLNCKQYALETTTKNMQWAACLS